MRSKSVTAYLHLPRRLYLGVVAALASTLLLAACDGQLDINFQDQGPAPAPEDNGFVDAPVVESATGTVDAVDVEAGEIVVLLNGDGQLVLSTNQETVITVDGIESSLAAIALGLAVEVAYDAETMAATSIASSNGEEYNGHSNAVATGTVDLIDADAGTLTVLLDTGEQLYLFTSEETVITLDGETSTLAEIAHGLAVEVTYDAESMMVVSIAAFSNEGNGNGNGNGYAVPSNGPATGTVDQVEAYSGEVSVILETGEQVSLIADEETEVIVEGTEGSLAELSTGMMVQVVFHAETHVIVSIVATTTHVDGDDPNGGDNPNGYDSSNGTDDPNGNENPNGNGSSDDDGANEPPAFVKITHEGTVHSIDFDQQRIVIELDSGGLIDVSVGPGSSRSLIANGEEVGLDDVGVGARVRLEYTINTKSSVVTLIDEAPEAEILEAEGSIEAMDPQAGSLSILLETSDVLTVYVDAETSILLNGATATLDELPLGATAKVSYDAETYMASSIDVEAAGNPGEEEADATVEDVDPASGAITVTLETGVTVLLYLGSQTVITVNGGAGSLADLAYGVDVHVVFDAETYVVSEIHLESDS